MKREIKFRGYLEWFDGGGYMCDGEDFTTLFRAEDSSIGRNGDNDGIWHYMQYTGFKDKNGVEIYEGDILKTYPILASDSIGDESFNVSVYWFNGSFISNGILTEFQSINSEVIGNIYENPELIK